MEKYMIKIDNFDVLSPVYNKLLKINNNINN